MAQIGNDATGTPVLEMVIRKLAEPLEVNEQTAVAVLDVITPLGVVLTEGLSMTIDGGREESAAFQICTEQGCLVREPVGDELITRLKRGRRRDALGVRRQPGGGDERHLAERVHEGLLGDALRSAAERSGAP